MKRIFKLEDIRKDRVYLYLNNIIGNDYGVQYCLVSEFTNDGDIFLKDVSLYRCPPATCIRFLNHDDRSLYKDYLYEVGEYT